MDGDATEENSRLRYHILAGDDYGMLSLNESNGDLRFDHWEDELWDKDGEQFLVIVAKDSGTPQRSAIKQLHIQWPEDDNTSSVPMFDVPIYRKFVEEEIRPGTILVRVSSAPLTGQCSNRTYSLEMDATLNEVKNENIYLFYFILLKTFSIDPKNGEIIVLSRLDMEAENNNSFESDDPADIPIIFNATVKNECGKMAKVPIQIFLVGKDEFAPVFVKSVFTFKVSNLKTSRNSFFFSAAT